MVSGFLFSDETLCCILSGGVRRDLCFTVRVRVRLCEAVPYTTWLGVCPVSSLGTPPLYDFFFLVPSLAPFTPELSVQSRCYSFCYTILQSLSTDLVALHRLSVLCPATRVLFDRLPSPVVTSRCPPPREVGDLLPVYPEVSLFLRRRRRV